MNNNFFPLVSVAIPTLNSGKTLETTLISISKQTYPKIEVIVADGYSKDNTLEIAKKYNATICFGRELGRARYKALKASKGFYLFAFDSDQFLEKDVIKKCVELVRRKNYDALILREKSILRKGTFIEKALSYDRLTINSSNYTDPIFGALMPRFFIRKDLLSIKWPKTLSILDDAVLLKEFAKKKKKIGIAQDIYIQHHEVNNFTSFFKKMIRYGQLYIPTMKISPDTTIAHSLPRKTYFTRQVLLNPKILLSLIMLYFIKIVAVLSGISIYLVKQLLKFTAK